MIVDKMQLHVVVTQAQDFGSRFIKTLHDGFIFVTALLTHNFILEMINDKHFNGPILGTIAFLIVITILLSYLLKYYDNRIAALNDDYDKRHFTIHV